MKRRTFITHTLTGGIMISNLQLLAKIAETWPDEETLMPVLFIGHGSPMNAVEDNVYTQSWKEIAAKLPRPKAILSVSAHWETHGTFVTAMENPRTIYDFYGFPEFMYEMEYASPGSPDFAELTQAVVPDEKIQLDHQWGLDHGTWSVLKHIYPDASIPVYQLSLNKGKTLLEHYDLAQQLKILRKKGVMIMGSGNIVHNLRTLMMGLAETALDWAIEFDQKIKEVIDNREFEKLISYRDWGKMAQLSVPTAEHYLPLLYTVGAADEKDTIAHFADTYQGGGISMRSLYIH